jgi:hypothetical protein
MKRLKIASPLAPMVMWLAVLRGVGVGRRDAGHDVAGALAHEAEHVEFGHQRFHHREHRLVERDVHHLALRRH